MRRICSSSSDSVGGSPNTPTNAAIGPGPSVARDRDTVVMDFEPRDDTQEQTVGSALDGGLDEAPIGKLPAGFDPVAPAAETLVDISHLDFFYNTTQALGLSAGGVIGGILVKYSGVESVFVFGAAMMFLWFIAAFSMREPQKRQLPASANSREGELKHGLSQ